MTQTRKHNDLIRDFTEKLLNLLDQKASGGRRSYGFEYEFLSDTPLTLKHMERLYAFLPECGFAPDGSSFCSSSGIYINFEPGGQIEYHSPPMFPEDDDRFHEILQVIEATNSQIFRELGIQYFGTGFINDRRDAPLCLEAVRYKNLHKRMPLCGSRGHEMMKGTASIHLHVLIRSLEELLPLFISLYRMSVSNEFKMLPDRQDIWNNTDPCRCGLPFGPFEAYDQPDQLIEAMVGVTLQADDIDKNIPFEQTANISFDAFLYHITTLFTDIRLNIKGPTLELRTLDSLPLSLFEPKWKKFISILEDVK